MGKKIENDMGNGEIKPILWIVLSKLMVAFSWEAIKIVQSSKNEVILASISVYQWE